MFLSNYLSETWVCDSGQMHDALSRTILAFFIPWPWEAGGCSRSMGLADHVLPWTVWSEPLHPCGRCVTMTTRLHLQTVMT